MGEHYDERFTAFIDILGFSNLVREAENSNIKRNEIIKALKEIKNADTRDYLGREPEDLESDYKVSYFSDCILISTAMNSDGFWHIMFVIEQLTNNLLNIGFLIRGALTCDKLFHEKPIVFGQGLIKAYELETNIAQYPRIILDKKAYQKAEEFALSIKGAKQMMNARLIRDFDGVYYINFLMNLDFFNNGPKLSRQHPYQETGEKIRSFIISNLEKTIDNPRIFDKYKWLAKYWNENVCHGRLDDDQTLLHIPI